MTPLTKIGIELAFCILFLSFGFFGLLFCVMAFFAHRKSNELLTSWIENTEGPVLEWSKMCYTDSEWDQFRKEELGQTGRSAVIYELSTYISWAVVWVLTFLFTCIFIVVDGEPLGDLPWSAFVVILGIIFATFMTGLVVLLPILKYQIKNSNLAKPLDFRCDSRGMYWQEECIFWRPEDYSCFLACPVIIGCRFNKYNEMMIPCLEFVFEYTGSKGAKHYHIHRIPIPRDLIAQAEAFAATVRENNSTMVAQCWMLHLEGNAREMELAVKEGKPVDLSVAYM